MHSPAKRASRSRSFSSIRALSIQWQDKVVNPVGSEGLSPCPFLLWPWRNAPSFRHIQALLANGSAEERCVRIRPQVFP